MNRFLSLLLTLLPPALVAQENLLINGDFEAYSYESERVTNDGVPKFSATFLNRPRQYFNVPEWFVPLGTPDLVDDSTICHGKGCVGLFTCYNQDNYQEYLLGTLVEPMTADSTYTITFNIRPGDRNGTIKHQLDPRYIGFLFTSSPSVFNSLPMLLKSSDPKRVKLPIFLDSTWTTISLEYTAKGGETHVMIGAFSDPDANRRRASMREVDPVGYVHLDDIWIDRKYKKSAEPLFTSIRYEEDIYTLTPTQQTEIERFIDSVDALQQPYSIDIVSYASEKGDKVYNQKLSERRAETIRAYLINLNIPASRIAIEGRGELANCSNNCRRTDIVVKIE